MHSLLALLSKSLEGVGAVGGGVALKALLLKLTTPSWEYRDVKSIGLRACAVRTITYRLKGCTIGEHMISEFR